MGYIDTEHYKLKKPEATNKYDVADMNNALDAVDALLFKQDGENKTAIQEIRTHVDGYEDRIVKLESVKIITEWI